MCAGYGKDSIIAIHNIYLTVHNMFQKKRVFYDNITTLQERGGSNMRKMGKLLAMCSLFMASVAANSACVFWMYQDENEELKRLRKF